MGPKANLAFAVVGAAFGAATIFALAQAFLRTGAAPFALVVIDIFVFFPLSLAMTSTLGIAWHAFACRRNWRGAPAYSVAGLVLGLCVPIAMLSLYYWLRRDAGVGSNTTSTAGLMIAMIYGGVVGTLNGFIFWLIRRPDRDPPRPGTQTP